MYSKLDYNINPLVNAIGKMPSEFTKQDIINYVCFIFAMGIEINNDAEESVSEGC